MTKKHFVAIAAALATNRERPMDAGGRAAFDYLTRDLADICAAANPAFNRARFLAACRGE